MDEEELVGERNVENRSVELIEGMERIKWMGVEWYFYEKWFCDFKREVEIVEEKGRLRWFIENIGGRLEFGF
ncbi:hypothetical protein, partial [Bacillus thuringiensis]|uniref:hypothetical protein n=1 Tax=Bacillus thuringiensis TaxID=1428 RepID=UPI00119CE8F4